MNFKKYNFKKYYEKIMSSKSKYIILLATIGIILIVFSTFTTQKNKKNEIKDKDNEKVRCNEGVSQTEEYTRKLEMKLAKIISKIKGVGKSDVMITLENGVENIYANSEKKTTNSNENFSGKMSNRNDLQKDIVTIDGKKGKEALLSTQREPKIKGVLIVCEGGGSSYVVKKVTDATKSALNIGLNAISVSERSKSEKN